jgi:hypothetical protein
MSDTSEIKRIATIERRTNSANGNPNFNITFTDGTEARTMSDSACSYAIGNADMREGSLVVLNLTPSGRIRMMVPA